MTVILDGGLATELEARGHDLSDRLWSARLLLDDPAAVEEVHLAYFRAGAQVATTGSYQATIPGFEAGGLDRATALAAIRASATIARRARDRFAEETGTDAGSLLIAGSVGPYGAMLADGSEYRGDYAPGRDVLRDLHAPRMEALLEAGVDLLALETIPNIPEAEVLVELLDELGASGWLSFQCRDAGHTAAGEPIETAVRVGAGVTGLVAIGVNCTAPRFLPGLLERAAPTAAGLPLIAYPNVGDAWDAAHHVWVARDEDGTFRPAVVASWSGVGATWLGGCCGTGPSDIAALAGSLRPTVRPS